MFMQKQTPNLKVCLVAVFTSRNCTKSFDSLSDVKKIFWHEDKIWAMMWLLSMKVFSFQPSSATGKVWGRMWPGTSPRAPGASSTWPTWWATGSGKSGCGTRPEWSHLGEWEHLSGSDKASDPESQQSVLWQVTKTGVSKNFTRWLVTSKAALLRVTNSASWWLHYLLITHRSLILVLQSISPSLKFSNPCRQH